MSSSEDENSEGSVNEDCPLQLFPEFNDWSVEPAVSGQPTIHCLPDEILLKILSYLDLLDRLKYSYVCRRWYNLNLTAFGAITHLDVSEATLYRKDEDDDTRAQKIAKQMIGLMRHSLGQCDLVSFPVTPGIFTALHSCQHLTTLKLRDIPLSKKVAGTFSTNAPPLLETLIIEKCPNLREKCLKKILSNVPKLVRLELVSQHCIKGMAILMCLRKHPLKHLKLCFCEKVQSNTFSRILAAFSGTLEILEFPITVFDEQIADRITPLPNLKKLIIGAKSKYFNFGTTSYTTIIKFLSPQTLPGLEKLNLGGVIVELSMKNHFVGILENIHQLEKFEHLDISCDPANVPYFSPHNPVYPYLQPLGRLRNLRILEVNGEVTGEEFGWIESCRSLTSLSLQSSLVADSDIVSLISVLDNLKFLDIRNCRNITGEFADQCKTLARTNPLVVHCNNLLEFYVKRGAPSFLTVTEHEECEESGIWRDDYEDPYQYLIDARGW